MSSSDKELETLDNIIEQALEELENEATNNEVSKIEPVTEKEFKSPNVQIKLTLNGKDVPSEEITKVLEETKETVTKELKKKTEEFLTSEEFKNMNHAFNHLGMTTKNFFSQFEDVIKLVAEGSVDLKANRLEEEEPEPEEDTEDDSESSEETEESEHDDEEETDSEDSEDSETESDQEEDEETEDDSEDESVDRDKVDLDYEDYVYVIYKNGEAVGFVDHFKDAIRTMKKLYHQYLLDSSAFNDLLRIKKKFWPDNDYDNECGAIEVYRRSPSLWNVFSETRVLSLSIQRSHLIVRVNTK
jgi:hypothetical protein